VQQAERIHWILNPAFNNQEFKLSIHHSHPKGRRGGTTWICVSDGIVTIPKQGRNREYLDPGMVLRPTISPPANTGHGLLAVIDGPLTGQFVRRIGSKWLNGEEKIVIACVENAGTTQESILERVHTVSPDEVVSVKEGKNMSQYGFRLASQLGKKLKFSR
jgi:hypothetical protein